MAPSRAPNCTLASSICVHTGTVHQDAMALYPQARFILSANDPQQFPADFGLEVAFAGRSNAGKSSAINTILGRKALARTSKAPGQTRLINFFDLGNDERLVDLPGYGFAKVPVAMRQHWGELIQTYFEGRQSLRGVVLIVDARRGLTDQDRQLIDWIDTAPRAVHVLLTKEDKLTRNEARQALATLTRELEGRATAQLFSAHSGSGLEPARSQLRQLLAQKNTPVARATGAD
jgi:GTP-binding protein